MYLDASPLTLITPPLHLAQHNSPLVNAAQRGHAEVLQLLLNDERVRADERGAEAFELAASGGFDTAGMVSLSEPFLHYTCSLVSYP